MISLTWGTLPDREAFLAHVTDPTQIDTLDPDELGPLFPEDGFEIGFGCDAGFFERYRRAVNEGIDSHLEAVSHDTRKVSRSRLGGETVESIVRDPESMHTLLRRMLEHAENLDCPDEGRCAGDCEYETAMREVGDMLYLCGFEWT